MDRKDFIEICKMSKTELQRYLVRKVQEFGYDTWNKEGKWLYAVPSDGSTNVLLTAHLDTVHKNAVKEIVEKKDEAGRTIISSPQGIGGDDRCGVYIILRLLEEGVREQILFCQDEEVGGVGSQDFCETTIEYEKIASKIEPIKFMIELDRANSNDAVFYDCDNKDFTKFVVDNTGWKETWGTFSDISILAPNFQVAAVNLSCGYYKAHTVNEYVVLEEMEAAKEAAKKLINKADDAPVYEYIERQYIRGRYGLDEFDYAWPPRVSYEGYGYDDYYYPEEVLMHIEWVENGVAKEYDSYGESEAEAIVAFLQEHPHLTYGELYIERYM